jgi:methyl-accepting chemotaxis protein PixJ
MKTIDRQETVQPTPASPILATTDPDSFMSAAPTQTNLTEFRSLDPMFAVDVANKKPSTLTGVMRTGQTLQRQIILMILPFILIPFGIGGWMIFHQLLEHRSPQTDQTPADSATAHGTSASVAQIHADVEQHYWADLILLLSMGCFNLGVVLWIARRLSNSFKQVTAKLGDAANGNLSVQLELNDTLEFQELATNFNQLVANFNRTLQQQRLAAQANKLFGKIALTAQESVDQVQVYDAAASGITEIMNVDRVSIYRCNLDGSAVVVAESVGSDFLPIMGTDIGQMYFAESPAELERYHQGQILEIEDLRQVQLSPLRQQLWAAMEVKSMLLLPILAGKQLVGLLSIQQCNRVRRWHSWEVSFCIQASQRVGLSIDQITTWNMQSVELRRTNMLSQALQLNEPAELAALLAQALELIRQEFNLDRIAVVGLTVDRAAQVFSTAVKPGCLVLDETTMNEYLNCEIGRNGFELDQMSGIYKINHTGGLTADEIELLENLQIRARLMAPILAEGRLLGSFVAHMCDEERIWQPAEIEKFTTIAAKIGPILDRLKSIEQRATKLHYKNLLSEITLKLRQSLDRDQIITTALTSIQQLFGLDRAVFINLNDHIEPTIIAESLAPGNPSILGTTIQNSLYQTELTKVYSKGEVVTIEDIYQSGLSQFEIELLERLNVRANVGLPILVNNKLTGVIMGDMCHGFRKWEPEFIDILGRIGIQIGLVLNQSQLFDQRENDAHKSQIISNFTLQLRQSLQREDILNTAVELVRYALNLDRSIIFELDSDHNGKIIAESVAAGKLSIIDKQIDDCCIKDAGYQGGKTTAFADIYQAGLSECHIQMLENLQVRANLVVPISIDGQLFGLLIAHQCQAPRAWQPDEISLFNQLATQLALALNQVLLIEQREAVAKQSQMLAEITLKLRQSILPGKGYVNDETEILNIALPEIRAALRLDRTSILVVDSHGQGEGKIIAESVGSPELSIIGATVSIDDMSEILARGYAEGSFIEIEDLATSDFSETLISHLQKIDIKSIITTPIFVNNKFFGLFSGTLCHSTRHWEQSDLNLLLQLAAQTGIALTQAQLVRQLEAASIQQSQYAASQESAKQTLQKNAWNLLIQVDHVSQGDLTISAPVTDDEIGTIADSYNTTVASLRRLVGDVRTVSQEVVSTTNRNEISVAELSIEALQQSEDIGNALHRLQEMSKSIQQVVNNALIAESAVMESAALVQSGDAAMNLAVEGILTIRNTVAETAKKVKRLGESSQKISKVVNLISNFAAQTNLLALNASIEAARAGEEGRGFAVVAEEVRSLARQSATATGEIETLVASIQLQTSEVVMAMEAGTEQVIIGTKLVDETRLSLDRITTIGAKIGQLVESIAQAALLQSENSAQVTQSINQVATISTKTSTRADNVQASFQDLIQLAQELQVNIGQFKI